MSNLFHFIMCCATGGLWIPVWIICVLNDNHKTNQSTRKFNERHKH